MPALPSVPKVVRVLVKGMLQDDLDVLNRLYFSYSGAAPTNTMLDAFCTAVFNAWVADMTPMQAASYTLLEVLAEDLSSPTGAIGAVVGAQVGTRAGATLTAAAAAVVNQQIARRYRGGHPKTFVVAGIETDIATVGTWKAAFTAALNAAWGSFITTIEGAGWAGAGAIEPVNVSYYQGFTNFTYPSGRTRPRPTLRAAPIVDLITGTSVRTIIGSQRRRNQ